MKASERLRELDGALTLGPWSNVPHVRDRIFHDFSQHSFGGFDLVSDVQAVAALRNALPLIADVVEAAERAVSASMIARDDLVPTCRDRLNPALTALRDALEGDDK